MPATEEGLSSTAFSALEGPAEAGGCCRAGSGAAADGVWAVWAGWAAAGGSGAACTWGSGVGAGMRRRAQPAVAGSALGWGAAAWRPLCMALLCCTAAAFGRGAGAACLGCPLLSCEACAAFGRGLLASAGSALTGTASALALLLSLGAAALLLAEADSA